MNWPLVESVMEQCKMADCILEIQESQTQLNGLELTSEVRASLHQKLNVCIGKLKSLHWKPAATGDKCPKEMEKVRAPTEKQKKVGYFLIPLYIAPTLQASHSYPG